MPPTSTAKAEPVFTNPAQQAVADLARSLAGHRPIAFNINLARVAGDVKAGLLISQLLYWTRVGVDVDKNQGWIFKTREQWSLETGLSRKEQETARARLVDGGLIQQHLYGSPARLCFRVNPPALGMALANLLRSEPVQWTLFDLRSNEQHIRALLGRSMAFYSVFIQALGSVPVAIFATKALMVQKSINEANLERTNKALKRGDTPITGQWEQNWFSLKADQWETETGLRVGQIRRSKQELCQLGLLEEAIQTYPKKRLFARLNINALGEKLALVSTEKLVSQVKNQDGKAGSSLGLLSALAQRVGLTDKTGTKRPTESVTTDCRQTIPRDSVATICPSENPRDNLSSKLPGNNGDKTSSEIPGMFDDKLSPSSTTKRRQYIPRDGLATNCRRHVDSPPSPSSRALNPSGFTLSSNPARPFQQSSRRVSAPQLVTFSTIPGNLQQFSRRLSAPLHARAGILTTDLTTTTTTGPPTINRPRRSLKVIPEKRPVVVVVDDDDEIRQTVRDVRETDYVSGGHGIPALLIWPDGFSAEDRKSASLLFDRQLIPGAGHKSNRQQMLLDELAGNLAQGKVKRPLAYLRNLIDREAETVGGIVLEVAASVSAARRNAEQALRDRVRTVQLPETVDRTSPPPQDIKARLMALRQEIAGSLVPKKSNFP